MTSPEKRDYKKKNLIFNSKEGCWITEDESDYLDVITYKFPEDAGCTPFSSNPYYNHFIYASGLTFLGDYDDFKFPYGNEKVKKVIPMGYKSILIYERVCLVDKGILIFERDVPKVRDEINSYIGKYGVLINKPQRYSVPSWGSHELITYELKPNIEDKLCIDAVEDLNFAKQIAFDYSIKDNAKCIVCMIIEYVNWH